MSLDVYLRGPSETVQCCCAECGHTHTREKRATFYQDNITHNLNTMAEASGLYFYLWRPDEHGIDLANQLIDPLTLGLEKLKADPDHYKQFNAANDWGLYKHFVPFVERYLSACKTYPGAFVEVSR